MENIERCKVDESYLGDVLLVNEDLIWHSVHKYIGKPEVIIANNCIDKDDILQLGRLGFIKSIYAFETSRGIKFSSFSVTAIVREIRCFLRDSGSIIRPTRTANELIHKINRIDKELGYTPPIEELAEMELLGCSYYIDDEFEDVYIGNVLVDAISEDVITILITEDRLIVRLNVELIINGDAIEFDYDNSVWDSVDKEYVIKNYKDFISDYSMEG